MSQAPGKAERDGLAVALRKGTQELHRAAERSGIVHEILQGRVGVASYALYLRNLLPAYEALEAALEQKRGSRLLGALARREVYRKASIALDLDRLAPKDWRRAIPVLPSAQAYASSIVSAAEGEGAGLIAHAYTRYLGDLSGGQILGRILATSIGEQGRDLAFHRFSEIADLAAFKLEYIASIDRAGSMLTSFAPIEHEAKAAFNANIEVSLAVGAAAAHAGRASPSPDAAHD